jgi:hypothetical protein
MHNVDLRIILSATMPYWSPLLSGLVAAFIVHLLTRSREREAREAARRDARTERRNEFQRETLLALQDAGMKLVESTSRAFMFHSRASLISRATMIPDNEPRSDEVEEAFMLAFAQIALLEVRVRDRIVKETVQLLKDQCVTASALSREEPVSRSAMQEVAKLHYQLNEWIGEALGKLDEYDFER